MAYTVGNRSISKIGVVGSGQIGPDIALHMTKIMQPFGVPVVVVDVAEAALDAGRAKLEKKIDKGVESGAFKADRARAMKDNTTFTSDYDELRGADLVIEAATEDLRIKRLIFGQLEGIVSEECILASNSSHMEPEVIFEEAQHKARTCVIHYFFPAERNPMVEIVPGAESDGETIDWLMELYEDIGKVPIKVGSRYGYAMDPIFEGLFHAAALCVEEGLGSVKQVDDVARRTLKQGIGPFTAMNLTGGNPLTFVGLQHYTEKLYPWFKPTKLMSDLMEKGGKWETAKRGEKVETPADAAAKITERMLGAYFGIVGEILDSGISNVADLEMGVQTALVTRPPFEYMNDLGVKESLALVEAYAKDHKGFPVPACIKAQADKGAWEIPFVLRNDTDGIAVLTIRRPAVLNALNKDVFEQLGAHVAAAEGDKSIEGIVITGFGRKAFVSGADISMLAAVKTPEDGAATSSHSHSYLNLIENCTKPVVCAYNGLAFGGGNELALACHKRIARTGLRVLAGQPEPNLGIIPGAGGTQRLPRVIGFEKAWAILRTGGVMSGKDALESGLISDEIDGDLRMAAIQTAKGMAQGGFDRISTEPIEAPAQLPEIDLGHLSTAVDTIMQKAILEGLAMGLEEGLKFESQCFGEVCGLEDMRIGMDNFMTKGPRSKATFVNK